MFALRSVCWLIVRSFSRSVYVSHSIAFLFSSHSEKLFCLRYIHQILFQYLKNKNRLEFFLRLRVCVYVLERWNKKELFFVFRKEKPWHFMNFSCFFLCSYSFIFVWMLSIFSVCYYFLTSAACCCVCDFVLFSTSSTVFFLLSVCDFLSIINMWKIPGNIESMFLFRVPFNQPSILFCIKELENRKAHQSLFIVVGPFFSYEMYAIYASLKSQCVLFFAGLAMYIVHTVLRQGNTEGKIKMMRAAPITTLCIRWIDWLIK